MLRPSRVHVKRGRCVTHQVELIGITGSLMRFGELAGLTRDRLDLERCEIRITESLVQPDKGGLIVESPKSRAGKRGLSFPAELVPELRNDLDRYAERGRRGLVFVGPKGGKLRRSNFNETGVQGRDGGRCARRSLS